MIATPQQQPTPTRLSYDPRGGARALLMTRDREVLLEGPAGTGKTYAGLWKAHLIALKYPGMHGLLLRKTFVSLKASTLVTFRERILGANTPVKFWAARGEEAAHYAYPAVDGRVSKLYVGGMDNAAKVMSTEYDWYFWDEANEGSVDEWEALQTRLRYGVMPYQQGVAGVNPQNPAHWLNQRANPRDATYDPDLWRMHRIRSQHTDNPTVTPEYLDTLNKLSGVRRLRLYLGEWAAADGMVYEDAWDASKNIRDRATICRTKDLYGDCGIPHEWPRYLSIDFGYTLQHPFVCRWYAEDGEGTLWMYREIYMTGRLVEDHAADIRKYSRWGASPNGDPLPRAIICDHDAEGRATLERHLGMHTQKADKRVLEGIQAVAARMRAQGDGKPRLIFLRDSLVERDRALVEAKRPTCGAEEIESYIWKLNSRGTKDEVEKDHDHACLVAGTMVETIDGPQAIETIAPGTMVLTRRGYRRVLASGMTAESAPLMRARFSNGAELVGTPDHPVFANSQYIPLRAMRYLDTIETADDYRMELPQCAIKGSRKSSSTRASRSAAILPRRSGLTAFTMCPTPATASVAWGACIRKSGAMPMGQFLTVTRFTTKTTTRSTTPWRISNSSALPTITRTTTQDTRQKNCASCDSAQSTRVGPPSNGTSLKRGASGTANSRVYRLRRAIRSKRSVNGAARPSRRTTSQRQVIGRSSARTTARRALATIPALITSSAIAPFAANHSQPTATTKRNAAPTYVLAVSALASLAPVFNLTVEDAHEYFANGVLVHNCDCDRYLAMYRDMRARQARYGAKLF